jgi:RNA polymerase sigma-70 factor (ECF subfamily)
MAERADSFDPLLEGLGDYLRVVAQWELDPRLRSKLDPADLAQQAMTKALESWDTFKGTTETELFCWVRTILRHDLADQERKLLRHDGDGHHSLEGSKKGVADGLAANETSPSKQAMRQELSHEVAAALTTLPPDQKEALELRHTDDLSIAEIAVRMHRTPAAVAGLLRRGAEKLRHLL